MVPAIMVVIPSYQGRRLKGQSLPQLLPRLGYATRGVVYVLIGGLAILAAVGPWGKTTDSKGALQTVLEQPVGWIWLGFIAFGLALFALWRLAQSILDADRLGTTPGMLARRVAYLISAIANAALALFASGTAFGFAQRGSGESNLQSWVSWLMKHPFGAWAAMALGLTIATGAIVLLSQAWKADRITEFLDCPAAHRWWIVPVGQFGYGARGVVFGVIGGFLIYAGYLGRSSEARGLEGALDSIAAQPYGWILLAVMAAGLIAFGFFGLLLAFFRRIRPPRLEIEQVNAPRLQSTVARRK